MKNCPFIDDKNDDLPSYKMMISQFATLKNQRVTLVTLWIGFFQSIFKKKVFVRNRSFFSNLRMYQAITL